MTQRQIVISVVVGLLLLLAGAFGAGRFTAPSKVVTVETVKYQDRIVTEYKDRIVYVQSKDTAKHVITTTTKKPTGEVQIVKIEDTKVDQDTGVVKDSVFANTEEKQVEQTKTVTTAHEYPRLTLGAGVSTPLGSLSPGLAGVGNYRFAGPFGFWVFYGSKVVAGGVGVTF
jgi:hypothetical protein